jgi:thymidylate synthase
MKPYLDLLQHVSNNGTHRSDRTGVGTTSVFGYQLRFHLNEGFPLVTTKKMHLKSIIHELLWFLKGDTNVDYLQKNGVRIWNEWADEQGDLGPVYGSQWRAWACADGTHVDQISQLIDNLQKNPHSRRHIVSAWNVGEINKMALPPCHVLFQFYIANNQLSCQLYQRSVDAFLGLPFNIASYSLLTHMIAQQCGLGVGDFVLSMGDVHIYDNHQAQVKQQCERAPYALPTLAIQRKPESILDYQFDDFAFVDYQHHPSIKAPIAV